MSGESIDISVIKKAAEEGDASAQTSFALCYYQGEGIEQNYEQAVFWYTKAAEQGDSDAQGLLGMCYEIGCGVERDIKKALYWYLQSAQQGDDISQGILALYYEIGSEIPQDFKKAAEWHTKAANQGNVRSQFHLGVLYENGTGVEKDCKKAVYWYTKAAQQEDGTAQLYLGRCCENGIGTEKDQKQADFWYSKAAQDIYALESLDKYYEEGKTLNSRFKTAGEWYQAYAADGKAAKSYASFIREIDEDDVELFILSVFWYEQAALKGDIDSFYQLALMYSFNKANAQNVQKIFINRQVVPTGQSIADFVNKFYPMPEKNKKLNLNKDERASLQKRIKELAETAGTAGIFALDEEIKKEKNMVLKNALQMIYNGLDNNIISVVTENLLCAADDEVRQIFLNGIKMIQRVE